MARRAQLSGCIVLYLAIPLKAYHGIFEEMGRAVVDEVEMKLIIVDMEKEEIVEWLG